MSDTTLLTFATAIYIGSSLKDFFQTVINDLVMPILASAFGGTEADLDKITWQVGGVKLSVGGVASALINLALAVLVVSLLMPYMRTYVPPIIGGRR